MDLSLMILNVNSKTAKTKYKYLLIY